jgi:hypothetical protein
VRETWLTIVAGVGLMWMLIVMLHAGLTWIQKRDESPHLVSAKVALKSGDSLVCWLDQNGQMQLSKAHSWQECATGLAKLMIDPRLEYPMSNGTLEGKP